MRSNKTREKILDVSLKLFNEKKASNVSTVQIADAMKISPGNLYYYYANKEEVIKCILEERMSGELEELLDEYKGVIKAEQLLNFFKDMLDHCLKYKFFYTEISTLLKNDDTLMTFYDGLKEKIRRSFAAVYDSWTDNGDAVDEYKDYTNVIAENGIAVLINAVEYCDEAPAREIKDDEMTDHALTQMTSYCMPLFTENMKKAVWELL